MSSGPRSDRWTHRRSWDPLPGDDRRGKIDWIYVNLYLLSIAMIDEYKTFVRSYTFVIKNICWYKNIFSLYPCLAWKH